MVLQMTGTHGLLLPEPVDAGLRVIALLICGHLLTRPSEAGRRILPAMTLLAAAVVGRIVLAPIPSVQPMTMLLVLAGMRLGAQRGAALAILATLLTNAVLGHGPWTYLQATGWAFCAVAGGVLIDWLEPEDVPTKMLRMALLGTVIGFLFGPWTILTDLLTATPSEAFALVRGGWMFDVAHAASNVLTGLLILPMVDGWIRSRPSIDIAAERRAPHEV